MCKKIRKEMASTNIRLSLWTTCMGRLKHLQETLPLNLLHNETVVHRYLKPNELHGAGYVYTKKQACVAIFVTSYSNDFEIDISTLNVDK